MPQSTPTVETEVKTFALSCVQHTTVRVSSDPDDGCKAHPSSPAHLSSSVTVTDQVTKGGPFPNYRQTIAAGGNATTSLVGIRQTLKLGEIRYSDLPLESGPYYNASTRCNAVTASGHNMAVGSSTFPSVVAVPNSDAEYQAASKLLAAYIAAENTWRGGTAIAEFRDTLRMLKNPLRSTYRHTYSFVGKVGRLKKVYRRDPVRYGKLLGGLWLQYSFGLKPLMGDIRDAEKAFRTLQNWTGAFDTKRIGGTGRVTLQTEDYRNGGTWGARYAVHDRTTRYESIVRYSGAIRCKPPGYNAVLSEFGLDFTDLVPAVWEAVPWSFMVDYFVNVGEVLDSMKLAFADLGWMKKTVRNSGLRKWSAIRASENITTTRDYSVSCGGGASYAQVVRVNRQPIYSMPYPGFRFRIPGTETKVANIAALVAAIRGSKPR